MKTHAATHAAIETPNNLQVSRKRALDLQKTMNAERMMQFETSGQIALDILRGKFLTRKDYNTETSQSTAAKAYQEA